MKRLATSLSFITLVAMVHCSGTVASTAGGHDAAGGDETADTTHPGCRVPDMHVVAPRACGALTSGADAARQSCTTDSECSDGGVACCGMPTPRCLHGQCSPSECMTDDDCTGGVCSCQGSTSGYGGGSYGNVCVPSNCHSDSDCGPGGYCSPSQTNGPFYGVRGYYCHSCNDECTNDRDCGDGGCSYCAYNHSVGHWACSHSCPAG